MSTEFYNRNWRMPNSWNGSTDNNNKVSNYSMSFDGSSEYIDLGTDLFTGAIPQITFSLWAKVSSTNPTGGVVLIGKDAVTSGDRNFMIQIVGNILYFQTSTNGTNLTSQTFDTTGYNFLDQQWHHFAFVYKSGSAGSAEKSIYIDGVQRATDTSSLSDLSNTSTVAINIGRRNTSFRYFSGSLDHVAIFDYALSASQITTLYGNSTNGVGNPMSISPKPKAFYPIGDYAAFNGSEYLVNNGALSDYVFDFDGTNDYINSSFSGNVYACSLWFKPSSVINAGDALQYLISFGGTWDGVVLGEMTSHLTNELILITDSSVTGRSAYTASGGSISADWHHLCLNWTGSVYEIWLDGTNVQNATTGTPTLINASALQIGRRSNSAHYNFNGEISNVQIFNTTLAATGSNSIETIYNNGTPLSSMSGFTSLQGWWKLDASATFDSSTSTWSIPDDSSNSNTGTSNGMTAASLVQSNLLITQPYSRYALDFDGTSDYIDCGTSSDLEITGDVSISAWVYIATGSAYQGILVKRDSGGTNYQLYTDNSSTPKLRFYDGSTATSSTGTVSLNAWHHVVITVDSGVTNGSIFYIDGVASGTATFTITSNDAPIIIGALNNGSFGSFLNGKLSNCSIWNAALTSAQVTEIYNQRKPSNLNNHSAYSNLVSWWQLGENSSFDGTNWTVLDEKGTANGTSVDMGEDALVNGVGTSANGVTDSMGADENIVGEAPYSTANAISYGMPVTARVSGSGNTPT